MPSRDKSLQSHRSLQCHLETNPCNPIAVSPPLPKSTNSRKAKTLLRPLLGFRSMASNNHYRPLLRFERPIPTGRGSVANSSVRTKPPSSKRSVAAGTLRASIDDDSSGNKDSLTRIFGQDRILAFPGIGKGL